MIEMLTATVVMLIAFIWLLVAYLRHTLKKKR